MTNPSTAPAHTPTPWFVVQDEYGHAYIATWKDLPARPTDTWIADTVGKWADPVREANAAFIVRACNAHEELLDALETVVGMERDRDPESRNFEDERLAYFASLVEKARAADRFRQAPHGARGFPFSSSPSSVTDPLSTINGDLLRTQSEWLLGFAQQNDGRLRDADQAAVDGLISLLDAIRDYCHDLHGIDCLIIDPETKDRGDACPVCGNTRCLG